MPRSEVRHLALVIATAENGSLTDAARRLHLTPSALSHQLRGLEERLGVQLFERRSKRLYLTSAGSLYLASARRLVRELRAAEDSVLGLDRQERVELRVASECYTCYSWLPAVVRHFDAQDARVDVRIVVEATRRPIASLLAGDIDVGVVSSPLRHARLASAPLFRDELVVLMSASHPLAARARVKAADFVDQHLLTYAVPLQELAVQRRLLQPARIRPRRVSQVELTEALVELVRANLGIAVLARWALPSDMRRLRALSLSPKLDRRWTAVWPKSSRVVEHIEEMLSVLRAAVPSARSEA